WHEIFDDVSTAYHKKVAKDRANDEGLVVNPPDLGNLPGEGDVTYASEVADVLIPYTTREDTYHYYEERNYVNDVNREHTEVLQTYDRELKAKDTYTYGHGRSSYLDNQKDKSYDYLTNQAGSVTGLVQDGQSVASSSYNLYGSTKESTDTTGNPFAYNGEARDITGLDYLRARYYDSEAGTFLTEDSYQGELTDPLSQNRYTYVHNNPVNYTDPSGHFWKSIKKAASKAWNGVKKAASNAWNTVKRVATNTWNTVKSAVSHAVNWVGTKVSQAVNWVGTQVNHAKNWAVQQWNNYHSAPSYQASSGSYGGGYNSPSSSHAYAQQQQAQARAQAEQRRQQHIRNEYSQSTGIKTTPKTREAKSLFRNWGKALKEMYTHVCKTAKRVKKQVANYVKKIDWKKVAVTAGAIGVGIALTVATGGLGAPVAMAIGGAASGAIISGYDSYSSGQRGWALAGSTLKGAGLGAITGFVGGQFIGAGANVAANVTQNIANQTVRHVAKAGVEAGVETVIDTGISVATGNPISLKNVVTDYGLNLITNGSGSVSSKKSAKADVPKNKPKSGDVEVLDAWYQHHRPLKDVTPPTKYSQKLLDGPRADTPRLEAPKNSSLTRPSWRQSEIDVGKQFSDYSNQKSYLNGQEVPYGTKGSVRPEYYNNNHSVEVKNYNLENKNGKYNLVNNVTKQVEQRVQHLPSGSRQTIFVDIRGQNISDDTLNYVFNNINNKTSVDVQVIFKRD
ncbi:TPA: RHS repeat-associated core domain-containing protein, partial [Streptococcus suis]